MDLNHPTVTVALPIIVTIFLTTRSNNRALEQVSKRIEEFRADVNTRFAAIERRLDRLADRA